MNPVVHTLARYFLGKSVIVSEILGLLKQADPTPTHVLHTDQHGARRRSPSTPSSSTSPGPSLTTTAPTARSAIVPGSRRFRPQARPYEVPTTSRKTPWSRPSRSRSRPAPSIVWGGTTLARQPIRAPPLACVSPSVMAFVRSYMKTIQDLRRTIPPEVFERNGAEFARIMGLKSAYPVGDGPDREVTLAFVNAGRTPWS